MRAKANIFRPGCADAVYTHVPRFGSHSPCEPGNRAAPVKRLHLAAYVECGKTPRMGRVWGTKKKATRRPLFRDTPEQRPRRQTYRASLEWYWLGSGVS